MEDSSYPARYWHFVEDGRIECDVCPRYCFKISMTSSSSTCGKFP
jgi:hypothetical protein